MLNQDHALKEESSAKLGSIDVETEEIEARMRLDLINGEFARAEGDESG